MKQREPKYPLGQILDAWEEIPSWGKPSGVTSSAQKHLRSGNKMAAPMKVFVMEDFANYLSPTDDFACYVEKYN